MNLHFTFYQLDRRPVESLVRFTDGAQSKETYRKKLVIAPAPAAAIPNSPRDNSCESGLSIAFRSRFWSSLYEKNKAAFSVIAPTIGAGRPFHAHVSIITVYQN